MADNFFSDSKVKESVSRIQKELPDKGVCNGILFQSFCNTTISKDFSYKSLKRINAIGSSFEQCKFNGVAATGSKFSDAKFCRCDFTASNFQYCIFSDSAFMEHTVIRGANFSHSVFINCVFSQVSITESTLYDCLFENCVFSDSEIRTNTLENSTISGGQIRNIDLAHINLEYMKFQEVDLINVTLPPYQVPFIIGASTCLMNSTAPNFIYTDNGKMESHKYLNMYDDLAAYFYVHRSFFPLANILIYKGAHFEAFENIQRGIQEAFDYFDFRMIKHYCRLACSNKAFSQDQMKELYDLTTSLSFQNKWDAPTLHSYLLNVGEIRELLLNNSENKLRIEFVVKTTIDKNDLPAINALYNEINAIIKDNCSDTHIDSIELRHNSPYELLITCIDYLPYVFLFISAMYSVLAAGNKFVDIYKNVQEAILAHRQNELSRYEIEDKKLDIKLKKLELEQKHHAQENPSGVIQTCSIVELEHIMKYNSITDAYNIAPEYRMNKITNIPGRCD